VSPSAACIAGADDYRAPDGSYTVGPHGRVLALVSYPGTGRCAGERNLISWITRAATARVIRLPAAPVASETAQLQLYDDTGELIATLTDNPNVVL
jgi:hypothetical protein